jgi:hypothetical protein
MAVVKTEIIRVRIDPAVKAGLKAVAEQEHRSIANMVEVLIRDDCGQRGIEIPESGTGDSTERGKTR